MQSFTHLQVGKTLCVIDVEDLPRLLIHSWTLSDSGYAKCGPLRMHRVITGATRWQVVHHRNGDRLDNRKCNIVVTTQSSNMHCVGKAVGAYRWKKGWKSVIKKQGKTIHLGCFKTKAEAQRAYRKAAVEIHGELACGGRVVSAVRPRMLAALGLNSSPAARSALGSPSSTS